MAENNENTTKNVPKVALSADKGNDVASNTLAVCERLAAQQWVSEYHRGIGRACCCVAELAE
jgi:hypothetical protein